MKIVVNRFGENKGQLLKANAFGGPEEQSIEINIVPRNRT